MGGLSAPLRALLFYARDLPWHPKKVGLLRSITRLARLQDFTLREASLALGGRLYCHLADLMQHNIFFFGTQEPLTEFLIEKLMPQGGTFVDVGANIGLMSVVAGLRAGPKGRVVAIEPAPIIAKRLEENLCLNNLQADFVQVAAWDRVGDLALEYPVGPIEHWGVTRIAAGEATNTVRVLATTLDQLTDDLALERVDLVKVDVEGAEVAVLRGGCDLLSAFRPPVIVEVNPSDCIRLGFDAAELFCQMIDLGYGCWAIGERYSPAETPEDFVSISDVNLMPRGDNLLFSIHPMDDVFGDFRRFC